MEETKTNSNEAENTQDTSQNIDNNQNTTNDDQTVNENVNYKKVSKKKIVYIEIDDEITSIYDRIKDSKINDIYIVVPKRAALFQSAINLKILKKKINEIGKEIFIVTNDKIGIHLAHQANIKVYDKIEQNIIATYSDQKNPKLKISPLKAAKNTFEDELPKRLPQKKVSIMEIVKNTKENKTNHFSNFWSNIWNTQKLKRKFGKSSLLPKGKGFFKGFIIISLIVLLAIIYIALPGVTIYLTPKSNVLTQNINIVLADYQKNDAELKTHPLHMIPYFPIIPREPISLVFKFQSTGTIFQGENAHGKITIINEAKKEWTLVPKTRFQTDDGLVFRISNYVKIPSATNKGFGTAEAEITADEKDINGKIIGDRGNIGPKKFFLPGLKEDSRKQIYAENKVPLAGGKTIVIKTVLKEDIEAVKNKAKEAILEKIIPSLEELVAIKNKTENTNLALLKEQKIAWKRAIKYDEPVVIVPNDIIGKQLDSFDVTAKINAQGVAYKANELNTILQNELKTKKSPEKKIIKIDEEAITYRLFEEDTAAAKFRITATIKGIEQYELDPKKENGDRLIKKIKEHIVGKDIKEAKDYIQNLTEIHKVEIKTWPIWAPTIPSVPGNIKVEIVEE